MAKPRKLQVVQAGVMGCDRSRAASAVSTRAPLNRVRRCDFDSSSLIARTWDVGDGVKSSILAFTRCDNGAGVSI